MAAPATLGKGGFGGATTAGSQDAFLKVTYSEALGITVNENVPAFQHFGMNEKPEQLGGKYIEGPLISAHHNSAMATSETGNTPAGSSSTGIVWRTGYKFYRSTIQLTRSVLAAVKNQAEGWQSQLQMEMSRSAAGLIRRLGADCWMGNFTDENAGLQSRGTALHTGVLAQIVGAGVGAAAAVGVAPIAGHTALVLANPGLFWGGGSTSTTTAATTIPTRYIMTNARISVVSPTGVLRLFATGVASTFVTSVISSAGGTANDTIVLNDALAAGETIGLGDLVVLARARNLTAGTAAADTSMDNALAGLSAIAADYGTFQNIAAAGQPEWQSYARRGPVAAGTNAALTTARLQQFLDGFHQREGMAPTKLWGDYSTVRQLIGIWEPNVRFTGGGAKQLGPGSDTTFDAGYGTPIAFVFDRDAPYYTLYGFNDEYIQWGVLNDFDWVDEGGAILTRLAGTTNFEAIYAWEGELYTDRRDAHCVLFDVGDGAATSAPESAREIQTAD